MKNITIKEALIKFGVASKEYTDKNKFSGSYSDLQGRPEQATDTEVAELLSDIFDNNNNSN